MSAVPRDRTAREMHFTKMSGGGNDFIVVEPSALPEPASLEAWIRALCRRGLAVGADGVLAVGPSSSWDARLVHYNADGTRSTLCGNGTRCAARWSLLHGLGGPDAVTLETDAGPVEATFPPAGGVGIRLPFPCARPEARRLRLADGSSVDGVFLEVGIPHFLVEVEDVSTAPVESAGGELRRHPSFGPPGTNVSFLAPRGDGALDLRTFERGVEGETLACGTACVAAAVLALERGWSRSPVPCHTRSGIVLAAAARADGDGFGDLRLEGDARVIYEGRLDPEALSWGTR